MLLQRLSEYERRNNGDTGEEPHPTLYATGALRYRIDLDRQGNYLGLADLSDPSSARGKRGLRRPLPQVQRSSGVKPLLLADKADYTLGYQSPGASASRTQACHDAYCELVQRCAAATGDADVTSVLSFLRNRPLDRMNDDLDDSTFDARGIITFSVAGRFVIDLPAVQEFWASTNRPDTPVKQCLVCREYRPTMDRLQSKLKGISGGQTSGTSLISANTSAFESFGLKASQTAPICSDCAESFTRGLNSLLRSNANSFRTGNWTFAFWTREKHSFDFAAMLDTPDAEAIKAMLESIRNGRPNDLDDTPFYGLSLSASGSRAVVRDWLDTTVKDVKINLDRWMRLQRIAPGFNGEIRYYGVKALAFATVREPKDLPVTTPKTLVQAALTGNPIPRGILAQAVLRCQAERRVTRPRAALIKLALLSQEANNPEDDYMTQLETANIDPGYLCGRLFAVLERAQIAAINPNSGIADRYYGTACVSPNAVFPTLLKGNRNHLHKLKRDNRGAYTNIEQRIEEITDDLAGFPKNLTLEQQGLFALGYYHERAANRRQTRENAQRHVPSA